MQKQAVSEAAREHQNNILKLEKKFFEEKVRLQKEANKKITDLSIRAHKEAVHNLTETTKAVYRDNIRLAQALEDHMREADMLKAMNAKLVAENRKICSEKDVHDMIIKQKITQTRSSSKEVIYSLSTY